MTLDISEITESGFFDLVDLFITVRDPQLRAFNRLIMTRNFWLYKPPKIKEIYIECIKQLDPEGFIYLVAMAHKIDKQGIAATRLKIKYRINPVESVDSQEK